VSLTAWRPALRIARRDLLQHKGRNALIAAMVGLPVLAVATFRTEEEAMHLANDTSYGLAAAVWTTQLRTAHRMARSIRSGMVYVNCYDADDITVPFGGFRQSGIGRDKSLHAFDKYTELKTVWIDLS